LDNRKANLRFVTASESSFNRVCQNGTGFKGVRKYSKGFCAEVRHNGRNKFLGCYKTPEEAAVAFDIFSESQPDPRHTNTSLGLLTKEDRAKIGTPTKILRTYS
jgi:hypothetical protein